MRKIDRAESKPETAMASAIPLRLTAPSLIAIGFPQVTLFKTSDPDFDLRQKAEQLAATLNGPAESNASRCRLFFREG